MSVQKTISMVLKDDPIICKVIIDNKIIEQINSFNYLRNLISYENHKEKQNKILQYTSSSTLLYGGEYWTIKARDSRRITAAEMIYMGITAGYTWTDRKTNTETANVLISYNPSFRQNTGLQDKLDTTCKSNAT
jgi:hypothetical protein